MIKNTSAQSNKKRFTKVIIAVIGLVVLAAVGALVANNNSKDKTPLTSNANSVTEKNSSGTPIGSGGTQIATNFPKNLPQYPGSEIKAAETSVEGSALTMESSGVDLDALTSKIIAYYEEELPKLGWNIGVREGGYSETPNLLLFYNDKYDGTLAIVANADNKLEIVLGTLTAYVPPQQ